MSLLSAVCCRAYCFLLGLQWLDRGRCNWGVVVGGRSRALGGAGDCWRAARDCCCRCVCAQGAAVGCLRWAQNAPGLPEPAAARLQRHQQAARGAALAAALQWKAVLWRLPARFALSVSLRSFPGGSCLG